jgi:hypothetical protein
LLAQKTDFSYDLIGMGYFLKALGSTMVIFLIFFGVPVLIYSTFQRFLGMVPPAQLIETNVYQLATLKATEAFILVTVYLMAIDRKRGKEVKYAFFIAFLMFVQAGVVAELWSHLTLNSPKLYAGAGMISSFISYSLSGWFLAKFYKTNSSMILPS